MRRFDPGEAYQFDWSHEIVVLDGVTTTVKVAHERLEFWQDGQIVAQHVRVFGRDKTIYDPLHYIPVLKRKPGALRNGAPFKEWDLPPALRRIQRKLERQPPSRQIALRSPAGQWAATGKWSTSLALF